VVSGVQQCKGRAQLKMTSEKLLLCTPVPQVTVGHCILALQTFPSRLSDLTLRRVRVVCVCVCVCVCVLHRVPI